MTTILFVHGTGVRLKRYQSTLAHIEERLNVSPSSRFRLRGCLWGDLLGANFNAGHDSVPTFQDSGGKEMTEHEVKRQTWSLLAADPLCELRLACLNKEDYRGGVPGEPTPGNRMDRALRQLSESVNASYLDSVGTNAGRHTEETSSDRTLQVQHLRAALKQAGIRHVFESATSLVREGTVFKKLIRVAEPPIGKYLDALANAIVAQAILIVAESDDSQPLVEIDEDLRDDITGRVRSLLGPREAAVMDPIVKILGGIGSFAFRAASYPGLLAGTSYVRGRRGQVTDEMSLIANDILLYQCRGEPIRSLIREHICELEPPVVLLGHSLGGVACVDLLISENLQDRVKLLISVGSQAPYFYEINALQSLKYEKHHTLPDHFPPWVNLYSPRDFLSYVGEKIFPGRIIDREVTTWQPFPQSHSAYWTRPQTYEFIREAIYKHVS